MMKKIILIMMGIFLLASVQAQLTYWQQDYFYNDSVLSHAVVLYDADTYDFVTGGQELELYIWYDIYPESWNDLNLDVPVDYCNLSIKQYPFVSQILGINASGGVFVHNETFTEDYRNAKYFLRMNDGDFVSVDVSCHFSSSNTSIYVPANYQIVTPTAECQACQYYEWSLLERDIVKTEVVGSKVNNVITYIYSLVYLNFEILLVMFWIVVIAIAIHSTGFIFIGLIWLFGYLRSLVK